MTPKELNLNMFTNVKPFSRQISFKNIIVLLGAVVIGLVIGRFANNPIPMLMLVPSILIGYKYQHRLSGSWKQIFTVVLIVVCCIYGVYFFQTVNANIETPPVWDFHLFWIFGRASALGLNPYNHESLVQIAAPLKPDSLLLGELYFFHEPPTLFLFSPLGWFTDIRVSALIWYGVEVLFLILTVVALWISSSERKSYFDLLFITSLTLLFYPTIQNIKFAQVNYLLLLCTILFWRNWNKPVAGVWLAIGIFIKPLLLVFVLFLILKCLWKQIGVLILSAVVISIVTVLVYGSEMFVSYFVNNPIVNKMPSSLYTEMTNQSLLATILRLMPSYSTTSPLLTPLFLLASAILVIITSILVLYLKQEKMDLGIILVLSLGLVIFPKTLSHYAFLLLLPIFCIWKEQSGIIGNIVVKTFCITTIYLLVRYGNGDYAFFAFAFSWIILSVISIEKVRKITYPSSTVLQGNF
jgi:hypothetical protein